MILVIIFNNRNREHVWILVNNNNNNNEVDSQLNRWIDWSELTVVVLLVHFLLFALAKSNG